MATPSTPQRCSVRRRMATPARKRRSTTPIELSAISRSNHRSPAHFQITKRQKFRSFSFDRGWKRQHNWWQTNTANYVWYWLAGNWYPWLPQSPWLFRQKTMALKSDPDFEESKRMNQQNHRRTDKKEKENAENRRKRKKKKSRQFIFCSVWFCWNLQEVWRNETVSYSNEASNWRETGRRLQRGPTGTLPHRGPSWRRWTSSGCRREASSLATSTLSPTLIRTWWRRVSWPAPTIAVEPFPFQLQTPSIRPELICILTTADSIPKFQHRFDLNIPFHWLLSIIRGLLFVTSNLYIHSFTS